MATKTYPYPFNVSSSSKFLSGDGSWKNVYTKEQIDENELAFANALEDLMQNGNLEELTYTNLTTKKTTGKLIPGKYYRITDYITTTVQDNTHSAENQFDIIVLALDESTLSENAYAVLHDGDTYFSTNGAKLSSWELKYCLDNDEDRFAWADSNDGTGVIYYMRDEWGNECAYDFKNIQFKRKIHEGLYNQNSGNDTWVYTFTWIDVNGNVSDASVTAQTITDAYGGGDILGVFGNSIGYANAFDGENMVFQLNDNVFISSHAFSSGLFDGIYGNKFGVNCTNNTLGSDSNENTFGDECTNNSLGSAFFGNKVGNDFSDNQVSFAAAQGSSYNTIGNYFTGNTFGNSFAQNSIGNYCRNNTFGDIFINSALGNNCSGNTFSNACDGITLGNNVTKINVQKPYTASIIIENGNSFINLTSSQTTTVTDKLRNITIAQGVNNATSAGTNDANVKTISHDTLNDTFRTVYQPVNTVNVSV